MVGIKNAFSSLSMNETSNNRSELLGFTVRTPKNFSSSLPNLVPTENLASSPSFVSNNYTDIGDDETSEQPIDFSQKYSETNAEDKILNSRHRSGSFNKVGKNYNSSFGIGMYAETDLDQPTDYSIRYLEDDSDLEDSNKGEIKNETAEFVQDTIKTYCTEDTPYETPFNFSTATSMSDLRLDDKNKIDGNLPGLDDKNLHTTKDIKSEFSSGLMSPEKPVNYAEEGTPGYFSRVDSCGSLNVIPENETLKEEQEEGIKDDETDIVQEKDDASEQARKFATETKAVKFEEVVNYAEETPLMFSRSSSLASLDSIEQHSIHDDRSSVISDFSRLTSGVISPSELPDSPTQTIPPSPKPRNPTIAFPQASTSKNMQVTKPNIFEDTVKNFQLENTSAQISNATSLSSLTIDDSNDQNPMPDPKNLLEPESNQETSILSETSEDEDILAACINIGMQNNRYSQANKAVSPPPRSEYDYTMLNPLSNGRQIEASISTPRTSPLANNVKTDITFTSDSIRTYCTEDTPALLSHAGSQSDLSVLSLAGSVAGLENKNLNSSLNESSEDINTSNEITVIHNRNIPLGSELQEIPESPSPTHDNLSTCELRSNSRNEVSASQRSSFISISEDSDEAEQALLQECILAGMSKNSKSANSSRTNLSKSADLSKSEQVLLEDCIYEGMKKTRVQPKSSTSSTDSIVNLSPTIEKRTDLTKTEEGLLKQCILSGIYSNRKHHKVVSPKVQLYKMVSKNVAKNFLAEGGDASNEDESTNGKFGTKKKSSSRVAHKKSYNQSYHNGERNYNNSEQCFTQKTDMPRQSSSSRPNINAMNSRRYRMSKDVYDSDSSDDSNLLKECVKFGMAKTAGAVKPEKVTTKENYREGTTSVALVEDTSDDDYLTLYALSSFSEESSEEILTQNFIVTEAPSKHTQRTKKSVPSNVDDSGDLTDAEQRLLQQCILEGMKKCQISGNKNSTENTSELTHSEQQLLRQCILSGMPKNMNIIKSTKNRDSGELTETEKELLQQCILAGMPKKSSVKKQLLQIPSRTAYESNNTSRAASSNQNKQWLRRAKDVDRNNQNVEHSCCIHCPKNNPLRAVTKQYSPMKTRRKNRVSQRGHVQVRDVNIMYVSSQILNLKKSREEWI